MESIFLKNYLENVGEAIHCLNTICVGLTSVADGVCNKPDDLVITWNPLDKKVSAIKSRMFAVKATYVFLAESTYQYMESIKKVIIPPDKLSAYEALKNADKVEEMLKIGCRSESAYRIIMLKMLVNTRNKVVHKRSKAKLSSNEVDILKENVNEIMDKFSSFNVLEALAHLSNNEFTLKDVSSHAANNIYMIRKLDEYFITNITDISMIETIIKEYDVEEEWSTIKKMENTESRKRKLKYFFGVYFKFLNESFVNQVIEELA